MEEVVDDRLSRIIELYFKNTAVNQGRDFSPSRHQETIERFVKN